MKNPISTSPLGAVVVTAAAMASVFYAWPASGSAVDRSESRHTPSRVVPPALQPGDTIALVAPASSVDTATFKNAATILRDLGFRVVYYPAATRRGYLAADDSTRAGELNAFIRSPDVKAIICMRGGYGTPRILDKVDYNTLRSNPKILVGYSDITALLLAAERHAGLVVFHGPIGADLVSGAKKGFSPFTADHLWPALGGDTSRFSRWGRQPGERFRALVSGEASGRLTGGNLSLVCATLGTPYEIDTRDAILFLEDVNEKAFRIDRMLAQLRLSGKLKTIRGVVLGSFLNCGKERDAIPLDTIFHDYFESLGVPVLAGFPAGHGLRDHAMLPLGARVRLDATAGTLSILENIVDPVLPSSGE